MKKTIGIVAGALLPMVLIVLFYCAYVDGLPTKMLWKDLAAVAQPQCEKMEKNGEGMGGKSVVVEQWNLSGVVGDSFGGFTALFSALAFGGVIIALGLQVYELKKNARVTIDEHFPLLVQKLKPGCISVMANAKGEINACVRFSFLVANASENVALYIKRRFILSCKDGEKAGVTIGSVSKQLNYHQGKWTLNLVGSVYIQDGKGLKKFLEVMSGQSRSRTIVLVSSMVYKSFFGAFGQATEEYRIKLKDFQANKVKAQGLLGIVSSGLPTTNSKLSKILGTSRELPVWFDSVFNEFSIRAIDKATYDCA